ncbi:MAG: exo-alpha-sialidase [Hyphomonadaceae bacterium]|nr:exo-alpha-sialidase [Hyphomonadaceae bacterium]
MGRSGHRRTLRAIGALAAGAALALAWSAPAAARTQGPGEPVAEVDLSGNGPDLAASVPDIAIDPTDPKRIAIVWRTIAMTTEPQTGSRRSVCHLSRSSDGGVSFSHETIDWGMADTPQCNAPYVDFAANGDLYMGATLVARAPLNPPEGFHAFGRAAFRKSHDFGATWSATASVVATDSYDRFAQNPAIPDAAKRTPWDGARGVVDRSTGAIYVGGGYPAPPGGAAHSERFYSASRDGGETWGPIRAWGSADWPQRWDGRMLAAHGRFAYAYVAGRTPRTGACLCVVFASSADDGVTVRRRLVTRISGVDMLVHYPTFVASPKTAGTYALAVLSDDATRIVVHTTANEGARWTATEVQGGAGVTRASRPALAYTPNGALALVWRGYHEDGSYDIYASASADGRGFGAPVRLSRASSRTPESVMADYAVRGDFITAAKADDGFVHAAWTDWRGGTEARVYYGRAPLSLLLNSTPAR